MVKHHPKQFLSGGTALISKKAAGWKDFYKKNLKKKCNKGISVVILEAICGLFSGTIPAEI